jgi:glycosyltransferase involved in cell wall biosynthesis
MIFHDVTPPHFFADCDRVHREQAEDGLAALPRFADRVESAVAHSEFSAGLLRKFGYPRIHVLNYILNEDLYTLEPDPQTLASYKNRTGKLLLAVGRIAPNKCIEDCLFITDYLNRVLGLNYRLILAGSAKGTERYLHQLQNLCSKLSLAKVEFTGEISQARLLALYQTSDALLLMSEHEGFGVPLVEAMRFDCPIFAYSAAAVPEVLGECGVVFQHKNWAVMAHAIELLLSDSAVREQLLVAQRARWAQLSPDAVLPGWEQWLGKLAEP